MIIITFARRRTITMAAPVAFCRASDPAAGTHRFTGTRRDAISPAPPAAG
jgi:hypothetical protein